LPLLSQVLTLDCSNIHWITPVYGFLGSTINQSIKHIFVFWTRDKALFHRRTRIVLRIIKTINFGRNLPLCYVIPGSLKRS